MEPEEKPDKISLHEEKIRVLEEYRLNENYHWDERVALSKF